MINKIENIKDFGVYKNGKGLIFCDKLKIEF